MTRQQSTPERAEQAAQELRTLIREAHEAAKDLRAAMKEARAQVDEYLTVEVVKVINDYTRQTENAVRETAQMARADMQRLQSAARSALQIVADTHAEVVIRLLELTDATMERAHDTLPQRRARIVDIGERLGKAYTAAGIRYEKWADAPPDVKALIEKVTPS